MKIVTEFSDTKIGYLYQTPSGGLLYRRDPEGGFPAETSQQSAPWLFLNQEGDFWPVFDWPSNYPLIQIVKSKGH